MRGNGSDPKERTLRLVDFGAVYRCRSEVAKNACPIINSKMARYAWEHPDGR